MQLCLRWWKWFPLCLGWTLFLLPGSLQHDAEGFVEIGALWSPKSKLGTQSLPSCHYLIVVYTRAENKWEGHLSRLRKNKKCCCSKGEPQEAGFIWKMTCVGDLTALFTQHSTVCSVKMAKSKAAAILLTCSDLKAEAVKYWEGCLRLHGCYSRCHAIKQGSRSTSRPCPSFTTSATAGSSAWRRSTQGWFSWGRTGGMTRWYGQFLARFLY